MKPFVEGRSIVQIYTIGSISTKSRRPILEASAPAEAQQDASTHGQTINYSEINFPVSRHHRLANTDSFKEMQPRTKSLLDGLAWIRNAYYNGNPPDKPTVQELQEMAQIGLSLVTVLVHRAENPFDEVGQLPDIVGDIHKSSTGLLTGALNLERRGKLQSKDPSPTAKEMFAFVDSDPSQLVTSSRRACPAPPKLIEKAFDVLISGKNGNASRSELAKLFPDFHQLLSVSRVLGKITDFETRLQRDAAVDMASNKLSFPDSIASVIQNVIIPALPELIDYQTRLNLFLGRDIHSIPRLSLEDIVLTFLE